MLLFCLFWYERFYCCCCFSLSLYVSLFSFISFLRLYFLLKRVFSSICFFFLVLVFLFFGDLLSIETVKQTFSYYFILDGCGYSTPVTTVFGSNFFFFLVFSFCVWSLCALCIKSIGKFVSEWEIKRKKKCRK